MLLSCPYKCRRAAPFILSENHKWNVEFVQYPCRADAEHLLVVSCGAADEVGYIRFLCYLDIRRHPGKAVFLLLQIWIVPFPYQLGEQALFAIRTKSALYKICTICFPELDGVNSSTAYSTAHAAYCTVRLLQNINHSTVFVGIEDIFANHFSNPSNRSNLFSICAIAFCVKLTPCLLYTSPSPRD